MAFGFFSDVPKGPATPTGVRVELLHQHGCALCPLNHSGAINPSMLPSGAERPRIYVLGEAPGEQEDRQGKPFVGPAGQLLRWRIPRDWIGQMRFSNVVRTRPPQNAEPQFVETECCRPSIVEDIELAKPEAIFGFGNVPLHWALQETGITKWRGKRVPVQVGAHSCWFYPMLHPSYVLRTRRYEPRSVNDYGSDEEFSFAHDLRSAFAALDGLPPARVHTQAGALADVTCLWGESPSDISRVLDFIASLYDEAVVGLDYETVKFRPYDDAAKLLSVALAGGRDTLAFALLHPQAKWTRGQRDRIIQAYADFLYDAPCVKVAHNLGFEMEWSALLFGEGVLRAQPWADTLCQAYILDPRPGSLSLEFLCIEHFGLNIKTMFNLDMNALDAESLAAVLPYNAVDAKYCRLLYHAQAERLHEAGLQAVYEDHLRRAPTMVLTQLLGLPLDRAETDRHIAAYEGRAVAVDAELQALPVVHDFARRLHRPFRPSNTADVLDLLNTQLRLNVANTEVDVLREVRHPIAPLLLESRKLHKVLSTYLKPMLPGSPIVWPDGRLHPVISICRTRTQRTASDQPNEQNWPKRGEGVEVRSQVSPGPGYKIVSYDFAGIQARNVAMESMDRKLVEAFWHRYDIHADWLERLVRRYPRFIKEGVKQLASDKKLFSAYRHKAKNMFVFPSFFGAQPKSIAADLEVGEQVAQALQDELWAEFPGILAWHETVRADYQRHGYVTGHSGFRRYCPVRFNEQINSPIQSDESVIVCDAMNRLSALGVQPVMMIHDDLTFIMHTDEVDRLTEVIVREMLTPTYAWINVPLGVEASIGDDWADMEKMGEWFSDDFGLGPVSTTTA